MKRKNVEKTAILPKFEVCGCTHLPSPVRATFGTRRMLHCAKFYADRCILSPLWGEKLQF